MQEVYEQLKAREEKVRQAEAQLADVEAEGLRRLRAREEGIEASLSAREARLAQQVLPRPPFAPDHLKASSLAVAAGAVLWLRMLWAACTAVVVARSAG